jgi:hypothetical protein
MMEKPTVKPFDWIMVGKTPCVVAVVDKMGGDIEVVHNPSKPANDDAYWTGTAWEFRPGASGYADKYPRLSPFVSALKGRR